MVGQSTLDRLIVVQIHAGQPSCAKATDGMPGIYVLRLYTI